MAYIMDMLDWPEKFSLTILSYSLKMNTRSIEKIMQHLLSLNVFTNAGIEKGEHEPGEKPHALNLTSYHDQGFNRLAMYITSNPEYSSWLSMNSS